MLRAHCRSQPKRLTVQTSRCSSNACLRVHGCAMYKHAWISGSTFSIRFAKFKPKHCSHCSTSKQCTQIGHTFMSMHACVHGSALVAVRTASTSRFYMCLQLALRESVVSIIVCASSVSQCFVCLSGISCLAGPRIKINKIFRIYR